VTRRGAATKRTAILALVVTAATLAACSEGSLMQSARGGMREAGRRACASDPGKNPVNCLSSAAGAR
jgi:hypothetical protein